MLNYILYKKIIDICLSLILLLLLLVPLIFVSLIIIIFDFQNPFFLQDRAGINGKLFKIVKFQTMKNTNNIKKITKLGVILRNTKIDELPQLINVIKLDMSLIGPRPLYLEFNEFYSNFHFKRLKVRPGITGLSQIKIKDPNCWKKKFDYDCFYVKKISISIDIYIFYKTIEILFNNLLKKKENFYKEQLNPYESFMKDYAKL